MVVFLFNVTFNLLLERGLDSIHILGGHWSERRIGFEPGVLSDLGEGGPLSRVDLEQLGDQVFRHSREAFGPFDSEMDDIVEKFILVGALEGRTASEQLEHEDAYIPDIQRLVMSYLLDHLWRQVLGGAAVGKPPAIFVEEVGPAEVSKSDGAIGVKHNVFGLDVSVDDGRVQRVEVLNSTDDLPQVLSSQLIVEAALPLEHGVELALAAVLQNQIEIVVVLVVVVQLDDVLVVDVVHDLHLKLDLVDKVVLHDLRLVDDLDREHILRHLVPYLVDLAKAPDPDVGVSQRLEVVFPALPLLATHD